MNYYEEKQQRKKERYEELSQKHTQDAESLDKTNKSILDCMNGQPILIGHHSEKRHRRELERIHNRIGKSIEHNKTAEYYDNKVNNIENPRAISSDDPEAITKLKAKLEGVLKEIAYWKGLKPEDRDYSNHETDAMIRCFMLPNRTAEKRRILKRIERLKHKVTIEEIEETKNEITLKVDKEENRVKLFFPGKPSEEIRTKLKSNGFRWSPYNGCWQAFLNDYKIEWSRKEFLEAQK